MSLFDRWAKGVKRGTDSVWTDIKWMEPFGYHGVWVVSTHFSGKRENVQLARERSLWKALWKAHRKVKANDLTDCRS